MTPPPAAPSAHEAGLLGPGPAVLAFDVGGTDIKSALIDTEGHATSLSRTATPRAVRTADAVTAVLDEVSRLAGRYRDDRANVNPVAIGLSVPGIVDEQNDLGVFSSNLGWRDEPIRERAAVALGLPVAFGQDVRAAAEAEHRLGAARGFRDVVILAIGTGIAGTIISEGSVISAGGYAGEFGHAVIDRRGEACSCGARGCLETVASARSIARRYTAATGVAVSGAREVLAAARAGDEAARAVWGDATDALAFQIAQITATIAPEAVVLGGGLSEAGPDLFVPVAARLEELLSFHRRPLLLAAALGEDAGVIGTALRARDLAEIDPSCDPA